MLKSTKAGLSVFFIQKQFVFSYPAVVIVVYSNLFNESVIGFYGKIT